MISFEVALMDVSYSVTDVPGSLLADWVRIVDQLRSTFPCSVASTLSLEYPNYLGARRADALARELKEAGREPAATVIVRALVALDSSDPLFRWVVIRPVFS